ncbi:hypothetical protein Hamer_G029426 [Homarus americanus]|uniref:Uncharacterized protein n=1 Tax=Homarus americanus TaxID=6706 RepID=A0A8J5JC01_HOMAM|nr:hypothetical protein Hamer_G029426 [Homarus americanus]
MRRTHLVLLIFPPPTILVLQKFQQNATKGPQGFLEVHDSLNKISIIESSNYCQESETSLLTLEPTSESQTLQQMSAHAGVSSEMLTDPLSEVFGDDTPAKIKLATKGSPIWILHLGSHLQGLTLVWVHWMGQHLGALWPHLFQPWRGQKSPISHSSSPYQQGNCKRHTNFKL